jgi:hypothetical protein
VRGVAAAREGALRCRAARGSSRPAAVGPEPGGSGHEKGGLIPGTIGQAPQLALPCETSNAAQCGSFSGISVSASHRIPARSLVLEVEAGSPIVARMNSAGLIRQSQRTDDRARRVGGSKQVGCQDTAVTCRGKQRMRAARPASCSLPLPCAYAMRRACYGNRRPAPAGEISDAKPPDINGLGGSSVWAGKGLMPVPCGLPGFSCARQDGRDMDSDKHLCGIC